MSEQNAPPPGRPLRDSESQEVIAEAWKLQEEAERQAEAARRTAEMAEAAAEVGLDPEHVPLAEGLVRARAEERARREVRRKRLQRFAAVAIGVGLALVLAGRAIQLFGPGSATFAPWSTDFAATAWQVEVSPGSAATLAFAEAEGRGTVASVAVEQLAPMPDGRYWVNVDSRAHPDWEGATRVSFAARGEGLVHVRLYLETPTERWRGPNLTLTDRWQVHTLDLASFERQEKRGSQWEVVEWEAPARVDTVSFKLGWYVNEPGSAGTVSLGDLRVE